MANDLGQTMAATPARDAAQIRAAEAEVSLDWKVGDVILDLYEVRQIREGSEKHYAEGGMGRVYRVHHKGWNVDLAAKVPLESSFQTEAQKENFTRECEAWVNLGLHTHAVSCQYVRRLGPVPVVFAEFMEGGSLEDWIDSKNEKGKRLYQGDQQAVLRRILDIAIQFAWGLQYTHEKGLIHQDVKPANVMMTPDGTAKVTDFGLAKARALSGETIQAQRSGMSMGVQGGGTMTPAYASPEQVNGGALTRCTDIWSWAVSVYEMFVGELTWKSGLAVPELLETYLQERTDEEKITRMPSTLTELLRQCLNENPDERPHNFGQIAGRLKEIYQAVVSEAYGRPEPRPAELLADGLNNRAASMIDLGKQEEAERLWEEALTVHRGHLESTYNLGLVRWRAARMDDATLLANLRQAEVQTEVNARRRAILMARVSLEAADCEGAIRILEGVVWPDGESREATDLLAMAKERRPASCRCLRILDGHTDYINSVCLSADGRFALSGSVDKTLKLWELASGSCLRTFEGHTLSVSCVCLSADGRFALSGSRDKMLKLWELETGRCLRTLDLYTKWASFGCLSADGRFALSGNDFTLKLWELVSGRCLRTFEELHTEQVTCVCLSADGCFALSGSEDKLLKLWEIATGRCLRTFVGHTNWVTSVTLSVDGRFALSGSADKTLKLWELASSRCLRTFEGDTEWVMSVCLNADGHFVLSGSKTLKLWEVATGRCLRTFEGHTACLSADGRFALSGSKTLKLWDLATSWTMLRCSCEVCRPRSSEDATKGAAQYQNAFRQAKAAMAKYEWADAARHVRAARQVPGYSRRKEACEAWAILYWRMPKTLFQSGWLERTIDGHTEEVRSVCLSTDGCLALSGSNDKTLKLWEVATGRCVRTFEGHVFRLTSVALSADGRFALSGSNDNTLKLWELATGRCVRTFIGHTAIVTSVYLTMDGRFALSEDGETLRLWEVATGRCLRTFEGDTGWMSSVCLSADDRFALSGIDKTLNLLEVATGRCLRTFDGHTNDVTSVALSADGHFALSGSEDKSLNLWELATGRCLRTFDGHTEKVRSVCLSADGRFALSGSEDKTLKLWELATGRCLHTFEGHTDDVTSVALSADGRFALSGSRDKTLKLWFLDWELEEKDPADWDNKGRPWLVNFLTLHTPYAGTLPSDRDPTPEKVESALTRRGKPTWTNADFQQLLYTLGCAGYGWLRPEGIKRELEKMAADWDGPPPLPWETK